MTYNLQNENTHTHTHTRVYLLGKEKLCVCECAHQKINYKRSKCNMSLYEENLYSHRGNL